LDFLGHLVQQFIALLYHFTGMLGYANYGVAIVLMTIIIKMALYPLTKKQIQSTKAMMELQPKLKQLQDRYKDDKMKLNEEVAKIYKASGVNPVAGCLPMLVQMPILFAIYYGVRDMVYEGPANFLWMSNIADPDKFYILPVLSAVTTYISSKQTMADNNSMQNQMMLYFHASFHWLYQLEVLRWSGYLLGSNEPDADCSTELYGLRRKENFGQQRE
jgi:YidC/Oxa1 family membrane protein insertase